MENVIKISPLLVQYNMVLFILVTDKIDPDFIDPLTRQSPEWCEVKDYLVKKFEVEGSTVVINKDLEGELRLAMDFQDLYINEDAAYTQARTVNAAFRARLDDINGEYETAQFKIAECQEFFDTQLKKTNLIN